MILNATMEVELPEDFGTFQEAERKIKGAVFQAGIHLMNELMEKYELEILKKKRFWKKDLREKKFQTIVGEVKRKRWRVFDGIERRCRYPLDEWMGVTKERATPALKKVLVTSAVQRSFRQSTVEVEQWTHVKRSVMSNWKLVQEVAREEMKKELSVSDWYLKLIPALGPKMEDPCPILCMDPDATYVKNQDSSKPDHEIKMMVMYTGKKMEGKNKKRLKLVNKQILFSRADEEVRDFFNRCTAFAMSHYGAHRNTKVIIHGDGDPWIKGYKENYWDKALLRLDPWHVGKKIRLATGLKEVPKEWWQSIYGKPDLLMTQLGLWKLQYANIPGSKEREKIEELIGYIKNNREGLLPSKVPMDEKKKYFGMYKRGSGTIESNIGHGIADRFKQRRMSWSKQGLENLSFLREKFLNGESENLFHVPLPVGRNNWRQMADGIGL